LVHPGVANCNRNIKAMVRIFILTIVLHLVIFENDNPLTLKLTALTFDPSDTNVRGAEWSQAAYYYMCVGQMDDEKKALAELKARETFPARSHRMAGEIYRCAGQLENAMQEFSASTSLEEYPPGDRQRGITFLMLGQTRSALTELEKSYKLNPKSSTTATWLARVENKLGMKKEAEQHLAQAFASNMVAPINYVNRAAVKLKNGDAKTALADADVAVTRDKWLTKGYEVRSEIRKKLGDAAGSESDAAEAKKLFSHFDF
jgi:predicted Zn-dependent protease